MKITCEQLHQAHIEAEAYFVPLIELLSDRNRSYYVQEVDTLFRKMQKHCHCCWVRRPVETGVIAIVNRISQVEILYPPPRETDDELTDELKSHLINAFQLHLSILRVWLANYSSHSTY